MLPQPDQVPLCVDLDGTLISSDLLAESLFQRLRRNPATALLFPFWLLRGRAYFKRRLARDMELQPASLPYNSELVEYLKAEAQRGRRLLLVTASDGLLAAKVAGHLGFFSEVLASDGKTNLTGRAKAERLRSDFGVKGYDYAGDAWRDLPVWASARSAIMVNVEPKLKTAVEKVCPIALVVGGSVVERGFLSTVLRISRRVEAFFHL